MPKILAKILVTRCSTRDRRQEISTINGDGQHCSVTWSNCAPGKLPTADLPFGRVTEVTPLRPRTHFICCWKPRPISPTGACGPTPVTARGHKLCLAGRSNPFVSHDHAATRHRPSIASRASVSGQLESFYFGRVLLLMVPPGAYQPAVLRTDDDRSWSRAATRADAASPSVWAQRATTSQAIPRTFSEGSWCRIAIARSVAEPAGGSRPGSGVQPFRLRASRCLER